MKILCDVIVNGISSFDLADWANVATVAGMLIAILVWIYTAYQVHQSTKISHGNSG